MRKSVVLFVCMLAMLTIKCSKDSNPASTIDSEPTSTTYTTVGVVTESMYGGGGDYALLPFNTSVPSTKCTNNLYFRVDATSQWMLIDTWNQILTNGGHPEWCVSIFGWASNGVVVYDPHKTLTTYEYKLVSITF